MLSNIKPEHVLPPSLKIPRAVYIDLDKDESADTIDINIGDRMKIGNLYILSSINRMPQNEISKGDKILKYVINGLFGNEDFESVSRVTLVTHNSSTSTILDQVIGI
jgi:hypothetical protein